MSQIEIVKPKTEIEKLLSRLNQKDQKQKQIISGIEIALLNDGLIVRYDNVKGDRLYDVHITYKENREKKYCIQILEGTYADHTNKVYLVNGIESIVTILLEQKPQ